MMCSWSFQEASGKTFAVLPCDLAVDHSKKVNSRAQYLYGTVDNHLAHCLPESCSSTTSSMETTSQATPWPYFRSRTPGKWPGSWRYRLFQWTCSPLVMLPQAICGQTWWRHWQYQLRMYHDIIGDGQNGETQGKDYGNWSYNTGL